LTQTPKYAGALCAALLLAGCSDFGGPIGGNEPQVSPQEQRLQALDTRLGDLARKVDNLNLTSQTQGISTLQNEVRGLRGDVEKLNFDVNTSARRSQELYQDLDRRLTKLENESRSARLNMAPAIAHPPPVPASQEEQSTYLAVFDQLKAQKYDEAITGFKDLLARWPQGAYADNAWYWLGESYYVKRDYDNALQAFRTLLDKFPASAKAPDALLKVGMGQIEKKQKDEARATLQKVIADYPASNAANLARQRLEQLK
jgi:tol-pal system protein YbgF